MKNKFLYLYNLSKTLTIYNKLKNDKVFDNLCKIVEILAKKDIREQIYPELSTYYTNLCSALYEADKTVSLPNYFYDLILYDKNIFSETCSKNDINEISPHIISSAKQDIRTIRLLSEIDSEELISSIVENDPNYLSVEKSFPTYSSSFKYFGRKDIWENYFSDFIKFYKKNGIGNFAKYYSFIVDFNGNLIPVSKPDKIKLKDLKLYESQKEKANQNMISFMSKDTYNNVLLYGDRGTGKSSCVKALANEYANKGLRIIQFEKHNLKYLGKILQELADYSLKFLIFIDDLTFNEDDDNINALKAVLEGSIFTQPKNIVIYATSNRRHIIKETFSAREGNDIHREDTIDEIMSLSDRFGLMITYQMPSKENFLEITKQIAKDRGLKVSNKELSEEIEKFALLKGYRSPRIARQYLDLKYK